MPTSPTPRIIRRRMAGWPFAWSRVGILLFESYADGFSASTPHKIYSGTKSFFAVAAILAQQEGLLTLGEKACDTLPEWRRDGRRAITIEELLSHTSGLDPDLGYLLPVPRPARGRAARAAHRYARRTLPLRRRELPGLRRNPEAQIGCPWREPPGFHEDKIFDPLDIDVDKWVKDGAGNPLIHSGLLLSAEQWAKFGNFVNRARNGLSTPIPAGAALGPLFVGHGCNPAYGLGFWLNRPPPDPLTQPIKVLQLAIDGDQLYPGGPRDLIAALARGHQMLYMIPSQDLVIVALFRRRGVFPTAIFSRVC